ncbi:hypothetical protein SDC9_150673 [bioreactor metagenome]|uniref:Uncharacterized protein n=1 Tax=bioreactor metagenome TaxID=1076179 RepID=A0A645ESE5_9ZZZZ
MHAAGRIGLDGDALHIAVVGEVRGVGRAQGRCQRRGKVAHVHALGIDGIAVDVHLPLGGVIHTVKAHAGQHRALVGLGNQLIAGCQQGCMSLAAAVLQTEGETVAIAQL